MANVEFKPIIPDSEKIFDIEVFVRESVDAVNTTRENVKKDFESVTATWRRKPSFRGKTATPQRQVATVWANNNTWIWGNRGTKPHLIRPKKAGGVLRFQPGYNRKSSVSNLTSRRGGRFGKPVFTKRPVRHPGSDGGFWDMQSRIKQQPVFTRDMNKAVKKAA